MGDKAAALAQACVSANMVEKKKRINIADTKVSWTETTLSRFRDNSSDIYTSRYKSWSAVRTSKNVFQYRYFFFIFRIWQI